MELTDAQKSRIARSSEQRSGLESLLVGGSYANPKASLRGRAKQYAGRYGAAWSNFADRARAEGLDLVLVPGPHGGQSSAHYCLREHLDRSDLARIDPPAVREARRVIKAYREHLATWGWTRVPLSTTTPAATDADLRIVSGRDVIAPLARSRGHVAVELTVDYGFATGLRPVAAWVDGEDGLAVLAEQELLARTEVRS